MAKPFPDAAFLFCILHWLEVPHSAILFCILHRSEIPYPAFISPLPTLPLKGAGFARWPQALLRHIFSLRGGGRCLGAAQSCDSAYYPCALEGERSPHSKGGKDVAK